MRGNAGHQSQPATPDNLKSTHWVAFRSAEFWSVLCRRHIAAAGVHIGNLRQEIIVWRITWTTKDLAALLSMTYRTVTSDSRKTEIPGK